MPKPTDPKYIHEQLNKRFTLNLLIQGSAAHAWLSSHHLVRDELSELNPQMVTLYDKLGPSLQLTQWLSDLMLFWGMPKTFWRDLKKTDHLFAAHPLFRKYGSFLSAESKRFVIDKATRKGVASAPVLHYMQCIKFNIQAIRMERGKHSSLQNLATKSTAMIWGIDESRLSGVITDSVEFGNLQPVTTRTGKVLRSSAAAYGGVINKNGTMHVHARGWNFSFLIHELTKGVAELICLHGLNKLDDETYRIVTREADRIEHEIWMLQAGGALWRMFLKAVPKNGNLAEALMHVALMDAQTLERFVMDLIEHPMTARATIADFFDDEFADEDFFDHPIDEESWG